MQGCRKLVISIDWTFSVAGMFDPLSHLGKLSLLRNRQHRATWVSTELMLTFPTPTVKCVALLPLNSEETGGRFRVWLTTSAKPPILIWDRKVEGGFPELKILVRSYIARISNPSKRLLCLRNSVYEITSSLASRLDIQTRSKKRSHIPYRLNVSYANGAVMYAPPA